MSKPIKVGDKWMGRVRKAGFPSVSQNFDSFDAANNFITTTTANMIDRTHKDVRVLKDMSVGSLIDDYNKEHEGAKFGDSKVAVLKSLKRDLGNVMMPHFTVDRLTKYIKARKQSGAGGTTIGIDLTYLSQVMLMARQLNRLPVNLEIIVDARANFPFLGLDPKSEERDRLPTLDEITRIKACFAAKRRQKIPMGDIIEFAMATGMRLSEITRILWSDVNSETENITVLIRDRKHPRKKKGNHQVVPLLADAWKIALSQPRISDRIFPWNSETISTIFPRAVQECEIEDLRFHDLRHEGITRLFQDGYLIQEVAVFSGHRDWAQLKRYTHIKAKNLHNDRFGNARRVVATPVDLEL